MEFFAELREVKSKKLITGDIEYKITLTTDNAQVLDLGKIPADTLFKVNINESR